MATLNDPGEGAVEMRDFAFNWLFETQTVFLHGAGICSFATTALDPRQWAYYAASYTGYCVEYETSVLLDGRPDNDLLLEVHYLDVPPVVDLLEGLGALVMEDQKAARRRVAQTVIGTKASGWQHEGEWRLVTERPGRIGHDPKAVTGVYVGYRIGARLRSSLYRQLGRRGIPVFEVGPQKGSYILSAARVS